MNSSPWLVVLGALAVVTAAVIAAISASWRQQRQLAHDAARQQRELEHDRRLRELDELKTLLDEAISAATAGHRAVVKAGGSWARETEKLLRPEKRPALSALAQSRDELETYMWRLTLRFGTAEPIPRAYYPLFETAVEAGRLFLTEPAESGSLEEREVLARTRAEAFNAAQVRFVEMAYQAVSDDPSAGSYPFAKTASSSR